MGKFIIYKFNDASNSITIGPGNTLSKVLEDENWEDAKGHLHEILDAEVTNQTKYVILEVFDKNNK